MELAEALAEYRDHSEYVHSRAALLAEVERVSKDAERYQWLRDRDLPWSHKSYPQSEGAIFLLAAGAQPAPKQDQCWCDATGIGEPGVSCGDCPKDYAAPVQAQPAKPLLVSDIVTMYAERPTCDADMIEFAREIEQAHGIKEPS